MMKDRDRILRAAGRILDRNTPTIEREELEAFVDSFIQRRERYLELTRNHGSPLYVFEPGVLRERAARFIEVFSGRLPEIAVFYAVKSNNYPGIARTLVECGLGLDVSSGLELSMALECGAETIVFSGPGKTGEELEWASKHHDRVTVLVDSFGELAALERVAADAGKTVKAGVRLTTDERGLWRKFGIPLEELSRFLELCRDCSHVLLAGLQFHTSWNLNPENQVRFIARLGEILKRLSPEQRELIEFIDIGGGFWPPQGEWLQDAGTPEGRLRVTTRMSTDPAPLPLDHFLLPAASLEEFADRIGDAVREHLLAQLNCRIYLEPGRWLCNDAMHLLLTVVDKKAEDLVITDGGMNAVGWERFEFDYFPVINLSHPELVERECYLMGSLCTPHDLWGYGYFGRDIQPGDVLLIPTQGAYTYSLRQEFIKPLPKVITLENS